MELNKTALRKTVMERRGAMTPEELASKSGIITSQLIALPEFKNSHTILCYMDFKNEVQTHSLLQHCFETGKRVALPRVEKYPDGSREMIPYEIHDIEKDIEPGTFGVLEPKKEAALRLKPEEIDLVIVPGVVFDEKMHRIGYGGGFYDRFLKGVRRDCARIAVAFEVQVVGCIPAEDHDFPMDKIITEKRVLVKGTQHEK